jgi:hypothetical protein
MIIKQKRNQPDIYMEKISYDEYRKRTNHPSYWYNLTPHPVTLVVSELPPRTHYDVHRILCVEFPASGTVARIEFDEPKVQMIDGFRVHDTTPVKGIANLPEPKLNVMYLVSSLVREQLRGQHRSDVFSPDTGTTAVRNEKGAVFAVRALQRA